MNMNIAAIRMLYCTPEQEVRTLMRRNCRLWMDTEMQGIEIINSIAHSLTHCSQEFFQRISLISTLNVSDPVIIDGKFDRFIKVRGYTDVS